jgi:hypothetical protein
LSSLNEPRHDPRRADLLGAGLFRQHRERERVNITLPAIVGASGHAIILIAKRRFFLGVGKHDHFCTYCSSDTIHAPKTAAPPTIRVASATAYRRALYRDTE